MGEVVSLREPMAWFEHRPLFGKTVLVTRPAHQAADMVGARGAGRRAVVLPAVEIAEPADWPPVDAAIARLAEVDWLVFTSANGVNAFFSRLRLPGATCGRLGGVKLAAIGPATAEALRGYHLKPDVVPAEYNSEGLVSSAARAGSRPACPAGAGRSRPRTAARRTGRWRRSSRWPSTRSATRRSLDNHEAKRWPLAASGEIDFITLTSSNIARVIVQALDAQMRNG